ncbi:hypothetical protein ABFX02_09G096800 [Erythranthe guttata]
MMMFEAQSFYIPKDNPLKPYGEDAHFINKAAQVIGVADGVGGWAKKGIDAGEYARELMRHAENAVYDRRPGTTYPSTILQEAAHRTEARGSSTACIVSLTGDLLKAANVGDSGFAVIRKGKTCYRSPVQQHAFNHPYQLGNSAACDPPEKADNVSVRVEVGDVVVVATDGLFDNLHPKEIEDIVDACMDWSRLPEDLARTAYLKSEGFGNRPRGPFAVEARVELSRLSEKTCKGKYRDDFKYAEHKSKYGRNITTGGKKDDITVVVAHIVPSHFNNLINLC